MPETTLFTLYGKALQSASADPVLPDPLAEAAVRRIAYDFGKLRVHNYEARIMAIRSLIVAEGLMMYLDEAIVRALLNRLTAHFSSGWIAFDAWSTLTLRGHSSILWAINW